ncbi:MAG: hypothetical protein ACI4TF_14290 [Oliverpabstia sp.]
MHKKKYSHDIVGISNPYPAIEKDGKLSFGGNQSWLPQPYLQKVGCGLIASTNLLLYLDRYGIGCEEKEIDNISKEKSLYTLDEYNSYAEGLNKKYFPVIPGIGMIGWIMVWGLNRYFRKHRMKIRATWGVKPERLWTSMEEMLTKNLPVILSVGPNFPFVWKKNKLPFYIQNKDGNYVQTCQVSGHYVTVTAMDETWLCISSWGKKYYINRQEYMEYACRYSGFLVSNMVHLKYNNA